MDSEIFEFSSSLPFFADSLRSMTPITSHSSHLPHFRAQITFFNVYVKFNKNLWKCVFTFAKFVSHLRHKCDSHFFQLAHLTLGSHISKMFLHIWNLYPEMSRDVHSDWKKMFWTSAHLRVESRQIRQFSQIRRYVTGECTHVQNSFYRLLCTSRHISGWRFQMCKEICEMCDMNDECANSKKCETHFHTNLAHMWLTSVSKCETNVHMWKHIFTSPH